MRNTTTETSITPEEVELFIVNSTSVNNKDKDRLPHVLLARLEGDTLETIGKCRGVTRERIRQLEAKGCEIIRQSRKKTV